VLVDRVIERGSTMQDEQHRTLAHPGSIGNKSHPNDVEVDADVTYRDTQEKAALSRSLPIRPHCLRLCRNAASGDVGKLRTHHGHRSLEGEAGADRPDDVSVGRRRRRTHRPALSVVAAPAVG
jgi:hypothetical protein